jgi:hypothetical protein
LQRGVIQPVIQGTHRRRGGLQRRQLGIA